MEIRWVYIQTSVTPVTPVTPDFLKVSRVLRTRIMHTGVARAHTYTVRVKSLRIMASLASLVSLGAQKGQALLCPKVSESKGWLLRCVQMVRTTRSDYSYTL